MGNKYTERNGGRNRRILKKRGYTKVKLIEEGYKALLEQAGEINTDLAKIIDGYDDFFDLSCANSRKRKTTIKRNKTKISNRRIFVFMEREHSIHPEREHSIRTIKLRRFGAETI